MNEILRSSMPITSNELSWFLRLRWLAVLGQLSLVLVAYYLLGNQLDVISLLIVIALVAVSNLYLRYSTALKQRLLLPVIILMDVFALTGLLYFSGGASNPFGFFFVVNVALAAILLSEKWTWIVALVSVICYGALFFFNKELPALSAHGSHGTNPFSLHLYGMWAAFGMVACILAFFFTRIMREMRHQNVKLRQAQERIFKSEKLAAVTAVVANAAHEINTPLATIRLAVEEMLDSLQGNGYAKVSLKDEAKLILSEVNRCVSALRSLREHAADLEGEISAPLSMQQLASDIRDHLPPSAADRLQISSESRDITLVAPRRPLAAAVAALVKNGLDASKDQPILLSAQRDEGAQKVIVNDRGCGMPIEVINRLGEPFFTTKVEGNGLGLGVFLAKSFAEKSGGRVNFSSAQGRGTRVELIIPIY